MRPIDVVCLRPLGLFVAYTALNQLMSKEVQLLVPVNPGRDVVAPPWPAFLPQDAAKLLLGPAHLVRVRDVEVVDAVVIGLSQQGHKLINKFWGSIVAFIEHFETRKQVETDANSKEEWMIK